MGRNLFNYFIIVIIVCLWKLNKVDAAITFANASCVDGGNFTKGGVYEQNLKNLFSDLPRKTSTQKFYNYTTGGAPYKVYGIYHCRGDVSSEICTECIKEAIQTIVQACPLFKEAIVWYYECMLRYSNRSIFSSPETDPGFQQWGKSNVSNYGDFAPVLASKIQSVIHQAAVGTPLGHFATADGNWTLLDNVYCLAQCTPDIDELECKNCLTVALHLMINEHKASVRVRIFYPSCQLRYDTIEQFYQVISQPAAPAPSHQLVTTPGKHKISRSTMVHISLSILVLILVVLVIVLIFLQCKKRRKNDNAEIIRRESHAQNFKNVGEDFMTAESLQCDFATLKIATNNFSDVNKIGEGGFGVVYRGTLQSGQEIAVKRLSKGSNQGAEQFKNEVVLVAKLQHRNLVRLLGFCLAQDEMLLVYEYVPNKSLDVILFDSDIQARLDWSARYKIIHGIARGMLYLHEDSRLKIVHRDLKASNILLDADMNPKISDFGLARNFAVNQKRDQTNRLAGTLGYMAPEYIEHGEISTKSDVYSFGVLVLEIISGRKISDRQTTLSGNLLTYAWRHWNEGTPLEVVDTTLGPSYSSIQVIRCMHLALLCVQGDIEERPSMLYVVFYLNSSFDNLPTPQQPAFMMSSRTESSSGTSAQQSDKSTSRSIHSFSGIESSTY